MGILLHRENFIEDKIFQGRADNMVSFYGSLTISPRQDWKKDVYDFFADNPAAGLVIDFEPTCDMNLISNTVNCFLEDERQVYFKNFVIQSIMYPEVPNLKDIESVLSIDKGLNISASFIPDYEIFLEMLGFRKKFKN